MNGTSQSKYCSKCNGWLPTEAFNKNASKKDGLQVLCRRCHNRMIRTGAFYRHNLKRFCANYRRNNPDKVRLFSAKHRARLRGAAGNGVSIKQWVQILEVHDYRCAYCLEQPEELTIDHVEALAKGGAHDVENVVPACRHCNSRKCDRGILFMII